MASITPITDRELQTAYRRSQLARLGLSFQQAIAIPAIRSSLAGWVKTRQRRSESQGKPAPRQLALI